MARGSGSLRACPFPNEKAGAEPLVLSTCGADIERQPPITRRSLADIGRTGGTVERLAAPASALVIWSSTSVRSSSPARLRVSTAALEGLATTISRALGGDSAELKRPLKV